MKKYFLSFFVILFAGTAFSQNANNISEGTISEKLLREYKKYVFSVNAYKRIERKAGSVSGAKEKDSQWRRDIGTAFPIDKKGHLITLKSVVDKAENIKIISNAGKKYDAKIIGYDSTGRICVLKVDSLVIASLPKNATVSQVNTAKKVFFLGTPRGMSLSVTSCNIENMWPADGIIEVESARNPGTSGTPLFDSNGDLIGFLAFIIDRDSTNVSSKSSSHIKKNNSKSLSFAVIPVEYASVLARSVINCHEKDCGWMGLIIDIQSQNDNGVVVKGVVDNSPADRAGIKTYDIITEFADFPVSSSEELSEAVIDKKVGDYVNVKVLRGSSTLIFNVMMAANPQMKNW